MLERADILVRRSFPESPPRVEYALTPKGRGLLPIIREMRRYGKSWLLDDHEHASSTAGALV